MAVVILGLFFGFLLVAYVLNKLVDSDAGREMINKVAAGLFGWLSGKK